MGSAIIARKRATSLAPQSFSEAVKFAEQIAGTSFVPDHFLNKPAEILAAMQYGAELGIGPLQSLNGLAVINGKVTLYASTMRALVESSGLMEKCSATYTADPPLATVVVRRVGREDASYSFGVEDAKAAGLAGRPMYAKYPKRMYVARAMSFALRDEFADVLRGIMGAEEMDESGAMVTDSGDGNDAPVTNAQTPADILKSLSDQVLADSITKGFALLEWNVAKQLVALREFAGRENLLYHEMRAQYETWLQVNVDAALGKSDSDD